VITPQVPTQYSHRKRSDLGASVRTWTSSCRVATPAAIRATTSPASPSPEKARTLGGIDRRARQARTRIATTSPIWALRLLVRIRQARRIRPGTAANARALIREPRPSGLRFSRATANARAIGPTRKPASELGSAKVENGSFEKRRFLKASAAGVPGVTPIWSITNSCRLVNNLRSWANSTGIWKRP
jgi:hypothetical protein